MKHTELRLTGKDILKTILLAVILTAVCFSVTLTCGNRYTYRLDYQQEVTDPNEVSVTISQDSEVLKIAGKRIENGFLLLELESVSAGKAYIDTRLDDTETLEVFYVHRFGTITRNSYLVEVRGGIVYLMSLLILTAYVLAIFIRRYRESLKRTLYSYENIAYLGIIIFLGAAFIIQCLELPTFNSLIGLIGRVISTPQAFSIFLLPVAVIVSVLVTLSNIQLLIKEGFSWKNMLGTLLGIMIMVLTLAPEIIYGMLLQNMVVDIFNDAKVGKYLFELFEISVYASVAYLECVLLAVIILSVKAARHWPEPDKDYVIILGCMINKDGTLTRLLQSRADRALEFANWQKEQTGRDITFIPSGGQGSDEIMTEGEAIRNYLLECGVSEDRIIAENRSVNTHENMKYSYELINADNSSPKIVFSTTNYHVFRAGVTAAQLNIPAEGIGARTKAYFWINAFIREFIATIFAERRKHVMIIILILLITALLIYLSFLANIR